MTATFPQRLWRITRSVAKWTVLIFVALRLLYCLVGWEENWRGAQAWAAAKKELLAKGETLDLHRLAPPGNPQDDLSKAPIFADVYQRGPDSPDPIKLDRVTVLLGSSDYKNVPDTPNYLLGKPENLADWQRFYRSLPEAHLPAASASPAGGVLQALKQIEPELNEVETAVDNPKAFWPLRYGQPFDFERSLYPVLKIFSPTIKVAQVIALRAKAHLENREVDLSEKDFVLVYRLSHSFEKNSEIFSYSGAGAIQSEGDSILWEGIRRHAWNSRQLQEMDATLAEVDDLALAVRSLRMGRARELQYFDYMQGNLKEYQRKRNPLLVLFDPPLPEGWWDQDRRAFCLNAQRHIEAIDIERGILNKSAEAETKSVLRDIYTPITQSEGQFVGFDGKVVEVETYRRLARVACRLEEFYLLKKQYPEKLDELPDLPPHLNQEVLRDEPLHYVRKGDGYLLYSTGWDGKNHGGINRPRSDPEWENYDWAWPGP